MEDTNPKTIQLPINRLSYSSLTQLLRNPLIFKLQQILGVYNGKKGISAMVGSACHEALKFYNGGNKDLPVPTDKDEAREEAIALGLDYLEQTGDAYINYGKTGTREKMLKEYTKAMNFYFAEEPEYHKIVMCEEKMESEVRTADGYLLPLPLVGIPDVIEEDKKGDHHIIDNKFTKAFTPHEDEDGDPFEDYIKIIQAQFLGHLYFAKTGIQARDVIFRELKTSENKDPNDPQMRDYIIPLDHEPYRIIFYNIIKDVVKFISNPDAVYLPNLADRMDGQQAGLLYAQGLLNADMSDVEVMHKVKDVAFTSKKFVTSRLDRVENEYLSPDEKIKIRMGEFGIPINPVGTKVGATVTQYQFKVSRGIRMSIFAKHKNDIAYAIEAKGEIRILAPIPGTALLGIEVPNDDRTAIMLKPEHFKKGTLSLPIGMTVAGEPVLALLNEMPHILVAGATGSGKSITMHGFITALTKQNEPDALRMTLIDPKRVELVAFAGIPHLHGGKIIYEYDDAVRKLLELVDEMDERYKLLEKKKCRDIGEYNKKAKEKLHAEVIVIDEFADFMLRSKIEQKNNKQKSYGSRSIKWLLDEAENRDIRVQTTQQTSKTELKTLLIEALEETDAQDEMKRADADVELLVVRIAQLGRAAGIHIILGTQSPRVEVITGLIKANFPTRIALTTSSGVDSEVILGERGAEKLEGKGDMIFMHPGMGKVRLQGFMIEQK